MAASLINSAAHGGAEQRRQAGVGAQFVHPRRIVADIAAQFAVAIVADQQLHHAALGLRLQGELAVLVLPQGAHQRRQHQRVGQQIADRAGVGVGGENLPERRAEPHHPPARIAIGQQEAEQPVRVGRGGGVFAHNCPSAQRSTDFWAWMRFSASSHTAEWAPSITASVTSSPR